MSNQTFPPALEAVNYEQLEAEFTEGCRVAMYPTVSLTTLAHVVMAAQYAMQAPTITATAFAVLKDFVQDALASAPFPPETRKLLDAAMPPAKGEGKFRP